MPDGIQIKIEGERDIKRAMDGISKHMKKTVLNKAMATGTKLVQQEMKNAAPVRTGRLKKAIKIRVSKLNTKKGRGEYGWYIKIYQGKKRSDTRGAWYGIFVDGGTKYQRAQAFMSRSYRNRARQAAKLIAEAMYRGLDIAKRKAGLR